MPTALTSCIEGVDHWGVNGDPATVEFALVLEELAADPANPLLGELNASSVFADLTEVAWTGSTAYARKSVSLPAPVDGVYVLTTVVEWLTSEAVNGPASVPTIALLYPSTPRKLLGLYDASYWLRAAALTLLNGGVTLPVATITVDSTTGFAASGSIRVGGQLVSYTGTTATTFTGCTGGTGAIADNAIVRAPVDMSVVNASARLNQPFDLFVQTLTVTT